MRPAPPDPPEINAALWKGIDGDTAWDVGANCGQTLGILTRRFEHVVAFEPAEECMPYLSRWTDKSPCGNADVRVVPIAISNRAGFIELVALPDKIDTGQLVTAGITGMEWASDDPHAPTRRVPASTLDIEAKSYGAPDFIKVDVEGHEMYVLSGAENLVEFSRPTWIVEFHSSQLYRDVLDVFTQANYRTETIRHPHYPPGSELWQQHGWIRAFPN